MITLKPEFIESIWLSGDFESYYSEQEMKMLLAIQEKLKASYRE